MRQRSATATRILDASRTIFNAKGYAATSVTEVAATLGMSQGNLTYHFPTKRDLAMALEDDALQLMKDRRAALKPGSLADDYVEHLLFGMELTWRYRFLMRDRIQYAGAPIGQRPDSELGADYEELLGLLRRIDDEDLFVRRGAEDIEVLARSLWIISRYWIDHLRELEGLEQPSWADQQRGVRHHLAILLPCLKASARREFAAALEKRQL
ncbi:TetR/AcrR family transcriptional regulator [Parasphingopyxis sp.]|uniref:TetR/AcrR family transcriptional regulator n=1 Tax=Parasphingopyxis sp. TaxID=1920299 RepID=UPI00261446B1|nr:TetR/AcrR family transcriptional regulator [Parasphingopyxis sp.]